MDRNETTTSELLARHLPKSDIVKAFNAIQAADIVNDGRPAGSPKRRGRPSE
jgi:8-hydroxy-5-deazaflavin:NADPH oxidoreductase